MGDKERGRPACAVSSTPGCTPRFAFPRCSTATPARRSPTWTCSSRCSPRSEGRRRGARSRGPWRLYPIAARCSNVDYQPVCAAFAASVPAPALPARVRLRLCLKSSPAVGLPFPPLRPPAGRAAPSCGATSSLRWATWRCASPTCWSRTQARGVAAWRPQAAALPAPRSSLPSPAARRCLKRCPA